MRPWEGGRSRRGAGVADTHFPSAADGAEVADTHFPSAADGAEVADTHFPSAADRMGFALRAQKEGVLDRLTAPPTRTSSWMTTRKGLNVSSEPTARVWRRVAA